MWVTVVAVVGITVYSEMAGRVATVTQRPVFDFVRERLGVRIGLANAIASYLLNALLLVAELCGVALAIELATDVHYLLWVPLVSLTAFFVFWRMRFEHMERVYSFIGLFLFVFVVAFWHFGPDWSSVWHEVTHPAVPDGEGRPTYFFYAILMLGAQMTPYEVFFFSSAAVEHGWSQRDLGEARLNVLLGYPVGGILAIGIQGMAAVTLRPAGIQVEHLSQTALPVVLEYGKVGLACAVLGIVGATFGSVLETMLSSGYTVAQHFGWSWGKSIRHDAAARFSTLVVVTLVAATAVALTTVNPITITILRGVPRCGVAALHLHSDSDHRQRSSVPR